MTRTNFYFILLALISTTVAVPALADQSSTQPTVLDGADLAATSGGSEASVSSNISDNSIGNVGYTGSVAGVYAVGNTGLTTLIENTGNQVSIATSTVVNVNFH